MGISAPLVVSFFLCFFSSINGGFSIHRPKLEALELSEATLRQSTISPSPSPSPSPAPTIYFEVDRPIIVPKSKPCSVVLLRHDFAYSYEKPPVTVPYYPPTCTGGGGGAASRVVLRWSASVRGRQFDRIFGVWLGGVELLRSCTAEPRASGTTWTVEKDVTRYTALFSKPSTLAVYLGNLVDKTYTGIFHVTLTADFYFVSGPPPSAADLVLPISRNLPLDDGLWFEVNNDTDVEVGHLIIPSNTYRAVLEIYLSFHSDDEFWYTNPPEEYITANNLTIPGNGPFREVAVGIDGDLVGVVWPFTVIYTGGINPLLWRPITGIASFNLPSYDIDITPFLGKLLDSKAHTFSFSVTDALDVWFIDANLHLWLDSETVNVFGELTRHKAPPLKTSQISNFQGLDGEFETKATRKIVSSGWVKSSHGNITTAVSQKLDFSNTMGITNNGSNQEVHQRIQTTRSSTARNPSRRNFYSEQVTQSFPLYIFTGETNQMNDSFTLITDVTLGFNERALSGDKTVGIARSELRNSQAARGIMKVKGNLVINGTARNHQVYIYTGSDGCYFRNVSTRDYDIINDVSRDRCTKTPAVQPTGRPATDIASPAKGLRSKMTLKPNGVWSGQGIRSGSEPLGSSLDIGLNKF